MQQREHPTIILIRGLPGSGKTYIASALRKEFHPGEAVMLDPDATDYESREYLDHTKALTADGVDPKLHAYRFLREKAYSGITDRKVVIWNQPFTNLEIFNKMVAKLRSRASEHNMPLPILVVEVEIDPALAKQRVLDRRQRGGHGPSDDTFARFAVDYESFASRGYTTITVHGTDEASKSVSVILNALQDLWKKY